MEFDRDTGTSLKRPPFDTNGDGTVDQEDALNGYIPGGFNNKEGITRATIGPPDDKGNEIKTLNDSSGNLSTIGEVGAATNQGRQNWRQLR
jgi:hypothetical protein